MSQQENPAKTAFIARKTRNLAKMEIVPQINKIVCKYYASQYYVCYKSSILL